jgi:zinc transport system permease protein
MEVFLVNALLVGIALSIVTGPLSCLILWQRLGYFGDAISHAALLGVALGIMLNMSPAISAIVTTITFALLTIRLSKAHSNDAVIATLAYGCLSLAVIFIALSRKYYINLSSLLFGDILAVTHDDMCLIYLVAITGLLWLKMRWRALLLVTIFDEFAHAENINPYRIRLEFMLVIAIVIAIAFKLVGALIISAMLIIPAMTARCLSSNPEQMSGLAVLFSIVATICGISASFMIDIPAGPAIVSAGISLFFVTTLFSVIRA